MPNHTKIQIERSIAKGNINKDIRNLFRLEKEKENCIKDEVLRDMKTLFELDGEDCCESIRTGNAFISNYIEYESNGDKDKTLSIEEYLDKIRPYLSNIINDHKTQGEWKIQFTIAINFFLLKILIKHVPCILRVLK